MLIFVPRPCWYVIGKLRLERNNNIWSYICAPRMDLNNKTGQRMNFWALHGDSLSKAAPWKEGIIVHK